MRRMPFESQYNCFQLILFLLLAVAALIAGTPQALAHEEGKPVAIEISLAPNGALMLGLAEEEAPLPEAEPAPKATFFQWEDRYGTLNYTDDPKRIPASYRTSGAVVEREFEELAEGASVSIVTPKEPTEEVERAQREPIQPRQPTQPICDEPIRWTRSWERQDGFRRLVYRVTDSCGRLSYEGLSAPLIER